MPKGETRDIDLKQWKEIELYLSHKIAVAECKLSEITITNNKRYLFDLAYFVKPTLLSDVPKEKLIEYLFQKSKTDAETTHVMRKVTIKAFYIQIDQSEKVKELKTKMPFPEIFEEDLPTDEEADMILAVVKNNVRDYALLSMMMELGCRPGEIVKLKRNSINDKGTHLEILIREGKTGSRRTPLPLIESAPALKKWLNVHPKRDPNAPLFIARYKGKYQPLGELGIWQLLDIACKRAGVRHHSPKQWRHRAATIKARAGWSEQQLKEFFGWTPDSKMGKVYIHSAGSYEKALEDAGIKPKRKKEPREKFKTCPICSAQNDRLLDFCEVCSGDLNIVFTSEDVRIEQQAIKEVELKFKSFKLMWEKLRGSLLKPDTPPLLEAILRDATYHLFWMSLHRDKASELTKLMHTYPELVEYMNLKIMTETLTGLKGQEEKLQGFRDIFALVNEGE